MVSTISKTQLQLFMSRLNSLERKRCKWALFKVLLNQGVKLLNEAQNNSKSAGIFRHLPLPLPP
jgi:hypothetical protein